MLESLTDLILAGLLLATIAACAVVYVRLRRLRTERGEMEGFIASLIEASARAEAAIAGLREVSVELEQGLSGQIGQAQLRCAELNRLIENGGRVAKRMETAFYQGARSLADRNLAREEPALAQPPPAKPVPPREAPAQVNAELLKALGALR